MATNTTDDRRRDWRAGAGDDQSGSKHKLMARHDTSQRLPRSDDLNETTLTTLDSGPAADSRSRTNTTRPPDQLMLPTLAAPTSSDDVWSNTPPANEKDTSSLKSDNSTVPPSAAIPARLPALGARQRSKDDLETDGDKPPATNELGSVESIKMDGGSQSGRLASVDGPPAWTREKTDDVAASDETKTPLDMVPAENGKGDPEDMQQAQSTSRKHDEDTKTSTQHTQNDDIKTSADAHSGNEPEAQLEDVEEQVQSPGENDSGVDVRHDEPTTEHDNPVIEVIEEPAVTAVSVPETQADVTAFGGGNVIKITPPDDDVTSSPSRQGNTRQQHGGNGDGDRLSVRKLSNVGDRRRSSFDARDLRQLQRSSEDLFANPEQPEKPRLVALAQRGEWSVLDQVLRAMDRNSFYEVNLVDEVCVFLTPISTNVDRPTG